MDHFTCVTKSTSLDRFPFPEVSHEVTNAHSGQTISITGGLFWNFTIGEDTAEPTQIGMSELICDGGPVGKDSSLGVTIVNGPDWNIDPSGSDGSDIIVNYANDRTIRSGKGNDRIWNSGHDDVQIFVAPTSRLLQAMGNESYRP